MREASKRLKTTSCNKAWNVIILFNLGRSPGNLRLRLFASLVLSVLLYNGELWVPTAVHIGKLHTFYMRAVRRIMREPRVPIPGRPRRTDLELLRQLQWPSIANRLRRRRLGYVLSLLQNPFPPLLATLQAHGPRPSAWAKLVLEDLRSMREWDHSQANAVGLDAMGDPRAKWQRWVAWAQEQPAGFKARARLHRRGGHGGQTPRGGHADARLRAVRQTFHIQ